MNQNSLVNESLLKQRSCSNCTKCCEGSLSGEVFGKTFYSGKPCHFVKLNEGCSVYKIRPNNPCASYKCVWLVNADIPEWMKPNISNAILDFRKINEIEYIELHQAGASLDAKVLSWFITYATNNKYNFAWTIDNGKHWIGSFEFLEEMNKQKA